MEEQRRRRLTKFLTRMVSQRVRFPPDPATLQARTSAWNEQFDTLARCRVARSSSSSSSSSSRKQNKKMKSIQTSPTRISR